jgi:hypothetical protein
VSARIAAAKLNILYRMISDACGTQVFYEFCLLVLVPEKRILVRLRPVGTTVLLDSKNCQMLR